jgi:hypothetical protein
MYKNEINYILKSLNELTERGKSYINEIENEFQKQNFNTNKILNNNGLEIIFYGIKIIIIPETNIDNENMILYEGQLNSYINENNEKIQLISYTFDKIGNINKIYCKNNFAEHYFCDLIDSILKYISKKDIKLQL